MVRHARQYPPVKFGAAIIRRWCARLFNIAATHEGTTMDHFISIHFPLNPTDEHLRQGREVMSLLRSMSTATDKNRGTTVEPDVQTTTVVPTSTVVVPPPPGAATPLLPLPANASTAELDSTGLPWDERIHSGGKKLNNDGSWKKRKGIQESTFNTIAAQIRATLPVSAVPPATVVPPPPAATPDAATAFQQAVPPPSSAPPPPPAATTGNPFVGLLQKITGRIQAGSLTQAKVAECCKTLGIVDAEGNGSLPLAAQRPEMLDTLTALIDAS